MEKESEIRYESRSNDWTEWSEEWLEEVVEGENEVTEDQTEDTFPPKELPKSELEVIQDASTFVGDKSLPHPSQPALLNALGGAIRKFKGVRAYIWVTNRTSHPIAVIVSATKPQREVSGGGLGASPTGGSANITTDTFEPKATKAYIDAMSTVNFPRRWQDKYCLVSVYEDRSEKLYRVVNYRVPVGSKTIYRGTASLKVYDYKGRLIQVKAPR